MTLEQTKRRRQAVGTIHDIVGAMRAIAAGRIQSAQRALASSRRYEDVVLRGMRAVVSDPSELAVFPTHTAPTLLLVMTSEQPLCGSFNQDVLGLAARRVRELRERGPTRLVVIGHRGARHLAAHQLTPDASEAAATSVQGIRDVVKRLSTLVETQFAAGQLGTLLAIFNEYQSISQQVPTEEQILPIDPSALRTASQLGRALRPPTARRDADRGPDRPVRFHSPVPDRRRFVRQ